MRLFMLLLCFLSMQSLKVRAQEPQDSLPEDFVTASIVITEPGEVLYSRAGHAFLRMQCPTHDLDFCFSYESEDVEDKVLTFLAGKLKMGLTAIPTDEYIACYKNEGRGVYQYDFNLPIHVKQNLWRLLDEEKAKGMERPYDYLERGCAISLLHILRQALGTEPIDYGRWSDDINRLTRRELLARQLTDSPWTRCIINFITNGSVNNETSNEEKLITPRDLVEQLQQATAFGRKLLANEPIVLVPHANEAPQAGWFTPFLLSVILLVITLACAIKRWKIWDYVLLAIQFSLGLLNVYLVCFSHLCATEWSWLIIPLNPLPLLLWHWRKSWLPIYTALLVVWIIAMLVYPHSLTDPAFVVLTTTLVVNYLFHIKNEIINNK